MDCVSAGLKMSSAELRPQHGVADATLEHMILALKSDVEQGCPAGPLFGENLIQVFAAYVLRRYGAGRPQEFLYRGGLTPLQLRRVRDYIGPIFTEPCTYRTWRRLRV
jgi:AraC family transcriptional regulator